MTVSTTDSEVVYVSGGPAFPIPYRFLDDSDIEAVLVKQDGTSEPLTGAQYTLSGAGSQNGGTLTSTYAAGILATPGTVLTISRVMDAVQPTDLRNQGKFLAETHETVFDRLTMLIQQGFSGISRALKRPVGKSYFDAEGRLISNVADPVSDQDAATKGWAGRYFGDLIDGATGLINTTTGILYDAGTLFDHLRFGVNRTVDTIAALRLLSSARNQRAFVLGYYAKGDGGGGAYFIDTADLTSADNGGSIIVAADGARWKLTSRNSWSVRQFGAKGDGIADDTLAIQAAIDALPLRGGDVYLGDGRFNITSTIHIGDGNGGAGFSTRNGVKLIGSGGGFGVSGTGVPTILQWAGASAAVPMIAVRGRISDVKLQSFLAYCNSLCAGISITAFTGCEFEDLKIFGPRSNAQALAVLGGTAPTGNYNIFNKFRNISIALVAPSSIGLYMAGSYPSINDTWLTTFEQIRVDVVAGSTGSTAAWIQFADSCSFHRCHFDTQQEPSANALLLDATGNPGSLNDYPIGMSFYDCSITKVTVNEDATSKIGPTYFIGHGVNDNETLPNHPRLFGLTANGDFFGHIAGAKRALNSDVNVQNTAASTVIYSTVLGSYVLGGGDSFRSRNGGVHIKHHGHYVNSSGANGTVTVAVFLGGSLAISFQFGSIPTNGTARAVILDAYIQLSQDSVTNQSVSGTCFLGAPGSVAGSAQVPSSTLSGSNTMSVNTANSLDLQVVVQHATASGSIAYTSKSTVVEPF